jgi:hypothetical protein
LSILYYKLKKLPIIQLKVIAIVVVIVVKIQPNSVEFVGESVKIVIIIVAKGMQIIIVKHIVAIVDLQLKLKG